MSKQKRLQTLKDNQTGMVAIVITLMVLIVITLITVTFTKIIRREQRQALDRQLNTQAFYAAESGVNDAVKELKQGAFRKQKCNDPTEASPASNPDAIANLTGTNPAINSATAVSYSCLTVDPEPFSLEYDDIDTAHSTAIPINAGSALSSITVSWQAKDGNTNYSCDNLATTGNLPPVSPAPCGTGVLRLDIVPLATLSRDGLINATRTVFLIPTTTGGSSIGYGGLTGGEKIPVLCAASATDKACKVTIDGLPGGNTYHLRTKSIYVSSSLRVTARDSSGPVRLTGVQAVVDSTGKANDVLRRIQVRVPLGGTLTLPDYALQSTDTICKRLARTGATADYDSTGVPGSHGGTPDTTPCLVP